LEEIRLWNYFVDAFKEFVDNQLNLKIKRRKYQQKLSFGTSKFQKEELKKWQ